MVSKPELATLSLGKADLRSVHMLRCVMHAGAGGSAKFWTQRDPNGIFIAE
jgi:hypothetical protein